MNMSRPPFEVVPGQTAAAAAVEIVAVFDVVAARSDKAQWVEDATRRAIGGGVDPAMAAASRDVARAIDAERWGDRNAYHNRQHVCEVALVACFLARLHGLAPDAAQRLLFAALVHDLAHDGRPSRGFGAERRSVDTAAQFLLQAGAGEDERRRLAALVLATAPGDGIRTALRAAAVHAANGDRATVPRHDAAPELDLLVHDASLARLATLLCEADVLPSAGLTLAHGLALQRRLAEEWQRPLHGDDKRRFLDAVLAQGVVGGFFRPNVVACRAQLGALGDAAFRR